MRCLVAALTGRRPVSAYETVLRATPARRAISPMSIPDLPHPSSNRFDDGCGRSGMDIGEIARRAGVARSTVSYALTGRRPVSAATKQRIQAVIDEIGYRPNAAARALK